MSRHIEPFEDDGDFEEFGEEYWEALLADYEAEHEVVEVDEVACDLENPEVCESCQ